MLEAMGSNSVNCWPFNDFQVPKRCKIYAEVLQGVRCLVDQ
jgi:hypothetical protein